MRRWLFRLAIALIALVVLVVVGVHLLLQSDLPRKWALEAATEQLGLEVSASSLSIGWGGETIAEDIAFSTVATEPPFLRIGRLRLGHDSHPVLIAGQSGLHSVQLRQVALDLVQGDDCRWNVQTIADRMGSDQPSTAQGGQIGVIELDELVVQIRPAPGCSGESERLAERVTLGPISASARLDGSILDLQHLEGQIMGGQLEARAQINLNDLYASVGQLRWNQVDLRQLGPLWPAVAALEGRAVASLDVDRTTDQPLPEPMHVKLNVTTSEGRWRGVAIDEVALEAYVGPHRLVVESMMLKAAGGKLSVTGLVLRDAQKFDPIRLQWAQLDLNQIVRAIRPDSAPVPGLVGGSAQLSGSFSDFHDMRGTAELKLGASDLLNTPVLGALYSAMRLKIKDVEPKGQGKAHLRIEPNQVALAPFQYFNRGSYVTGQISYGDIRRGRHSPMQGWVVGSMRPFRGIDWPGIKQVEQLVTIVQAEMVSVEVGGTVAAPKTTVVPFGRVSRQLRSLLGGNGGHKSAASR